MNIHYPIIIHRIEENEDGPYYMAYLPDFGEATCSAMGPTVESALAGLEVIKEEVIKYFIENNREIPCPSDKIVF